MEYVKFKDVAYFTTGKLNSNMAKENGKYSFFTCAPEPLKSNTYSFDKEAILLAGNNAEGNFHINLFNGKFDAYQRTYVIDVLDKTKLNLRYLYYILKMNLLHLKNISRGTSTKFLTATIINDFDIPYPNIDIQNKFAKILYDIDSKIKLNNTINNNLQELILYNYNALISTGEWEDVELNKIANITSGKRPIEKLDIGNYPVIGANGIMAYTSNYNFDEDLIITGRVGTLGVIKRYNKKIWASDNTLVIETKYLNYVENYLNTIDYYSLNRGSTQPLLTQGDLKKQIIRFNEELVLKFEKENQIYVDKIKNNEKENEKLSELRDTLLPKLMSGELDLENINI